jgi:CubicO group peptidase (beta-lactamase class C family)
MVQLGYVNPPGYSSIGVVDSPEWRRSQIPSTNTHATATGLARIYRALLEPGRLLSPALLAESTSPQSEGFCRVLGEEVTFGLGIEQTTPRRPFGPNPSAFGHLGSGGAVGFADPDADVAFGYVMNHIIPRWQSRRNRSLVDAVYHCH